MAFHLINQLHISYTHFLCLKRSMMQQFLTSSEKLLVIEQCTIFIFFAYFLTLIQVRFFLFLSHSCIDDYSFDFKKSMLKVFLKVAKRERLHGRLPG